MNIIIAGDLLPTPSNYNLFKEGDVIELIGQELYSEWAAADFRIFNLETVLADNDTPIYKQGEAFKAPLYTIAGIKSLNPQLVCTANNHIYDHGSTGYNSTIEMLKANDIPYVGSGENLKQSALPYIIDGDKKIGVYVCADSEFSIATNDCSGANPFDPIESFDHIYELKQKCDYLIVIYHGGREYYRYPSPYIQKICHKMADKGADVIILQHTHCIGCKEDYNNATIIYGQGNFIFDRKNDEFANSSLLIKINIEGELNIEYIPVIKIGEKIRLAGEIEANTIIEHFQERSEQIKVSGFIDSAYNDFSKIHYSYYFDNLLMLPKWLRKINRIFGGNLIKYERNKNHFVFLKNIITCDAHRELFMHLINTKVKKWK